jgi:isoleucyl-tRNA synthetase
MSGWQAPYVPGWDNHGMPIESAIIKQNKLDRKKMSVSEFRSACHAFAAKFVEIQKEQFIGWAFWEPGTAPTLRWPPALRRKRKKCSARCMKRGISTREKARLLVSP